MNKFHSNCTELIPQRATVNSAGYDFICPQKVTIPAHGEALIESNVSVELDANKVLLCFVRSSYGFKHGITLANGTGVIDSDFYPNTIKCKLKNDSDTDFVICQGDKYMQGVIVSYFITDNDISPTKIRKSGIGSTGN